MEIKTFEFFFPHFGEAVAKTKDLNATHVLLFKIYRIIIIIKISTRAPSCASKVCIINFLPSPRHKFVCTVLLQCHF